MSMASKGTIALACCVAGACGGDARMEALVPVDQAQDRFELQGESELRLEALGPDRAPALDRVGPQETSIAAEAWSSTAEIKVTDWYAKGSGLPFALFERGSMDEWLPTQSNFMRVLEASDGIPPERSAALWAQGDGREAFEICMNIAAASVFAEGYVDRELERYHAGQTSQPLAKEMEAAGAYLRTHVRDRAGFERALGNAHHLAQLHLWGPEGMDSEGDEAVDWCEELYEVLEHTTTQVYEQGIEPYLIP